MMARSRSPRSSVHDRDERSEPVTITLRDYPPPTPRVSLSASPNPVEEGSDVTVTATLTAALSNAVTIPLVITDDSAEPDDLGTIASIAIAASETTGTGMITTAQDDDTDDETFAVGLGTLPTGVVAGRTSSVTVTIDDDTPTGEPTPRRTGGGPTGGTGTGGTGTGQPDPAGFADVAARSVHAAAIDALYAAGITTGCATEPLRYCPDQPVIRAQMATFLTRALELG